MPAFDHQQSPEEFTIAHMMVVIGVGPATLGELGRAQLPEKKLIFPFESFHRPLGEFSGRSGSQTHALQNAVKRTVALTVGSLIGGVLVY